jgi:hypothetical protein
MGWESNEKMFSCPHIIYHLSSIGHGPPMVVGGYCFTLAKCKKSLSSWLTKAFASHANNLTKSDMMNLGLFFV